MRRLSLFSIAWALTVAPFCIAQSKNARQIAQGTFPSVVLLVMQDAGGQTVSLGSGFVVRGAESGQGSIPRDLGTGMTSTSGSQGLVATNYHVISEAASGYAKLVGQTPKYGIAGTVAVDPAHDLAVLAVDGLRAPALRVGDSVQPAVGDEVYAMGNPQGLEGTFSQGIVSAVRQIASDTVLQITAPISPGSSGGPVLNTSGNVIGIAVATFKSGQNLNLAIPSAYLASLMRGITSEAAALSPQRAKSSPRSILSDLGGPPVQGIVAERLAWTFSYATGYYSFTLSNRLREAIRDVYCLVIFLDENRKPIDVDFVRFQGIIPGGLAKRVTGEVDSSVQRMTKFIRFRVLDFRLAE